MQTEITMANWISMNSRLLCMPSRAQNPTSGSSQIGQTRKPVSLVGLNLKSHAHFPNVRATSEMLELAGRARLMDELMEDGVSVALPIAACEFDMLAFVDSRTEASVLVSVPINIVSFGVDALWSNLKAARTSGLLIARVWEISNPEQVRTFALTPAELTVLKMIQMIERACPVRASRAPDPSCAREAVAHKALEPFAMARGKWRKKIVAILENESISTA
jgi:hypothetical protein